MGHKFARRITHGIKTPAKKKNYQWHQDTRGEEYQQELPGIKNELREIQQELPGIRNPPRRITARTTRRQESTKKKYSKNYQASRICQEEIQQELPGIKNPPRRHSKNYQVSRHPPRRNPALEGK